MNIMNLSKKNLDDQKMITISTTKNYLTEIHKK